MILIKLRKKWAKTNIIFDENIEMDPVDKWFIDIKKINKKGEIKECNTIIKKDMQSRLENFIKNGWEIY